MEYRRRRSKKSTRQYSTGFKSALAQSREERGFAYPRYQYRSSENQGASKVQSLFAILLPIAAFAAVMYLLLGTTAGDRLIGNAKDKGILSVLSNGCSTIKNGSALQIDAPYDSAKPTDVPTAGTDEPSPSAANSETIKASLPRLNMYLLQMGVYSAEENCIEQCAQLKSAGAAGYIYNDNGSYRVVAAAYSDKSSASDVCERLKSEGYECTVYELACSGVELLITTDKSKLTPIETAFSFANSVIGDIEKASLDFDSEARSIDYECILLNEIAENAENAKLGIYGSAQSSDLLQLIYNYFADIKQEVKALTDFDASGDRAEFASGLKQLLIKAALRYGMLLKQICE